MTIDSPNALDYKALTGRLAKQQPITPGHVVCWRVDRMGDNGSMTQGVLFALAMAAFAVAIVYGLARRNRTPGGGSRSGADSPNTVAQWTEGETTRLLSSAELPGLYLLRPRFLTRAESVVYLLLNVFEVLNGLEAILENPDILRTCRTTLLNQHGHPLMIGAMAMTGELSACDRWPVDW